MTDTIEEVPSEEVEAAAEQAAAQVSFGQMRGAEPEVKPSPAPEQSAEEIEAETKASEEDLAKQADEQWLKGAPASVRESLSAIAQVRDRLRNVEGHIGGLTSVTKELRTAMTAARSAAEKAGDEAPSDTQIAAAAGSSAKWTQMKEDFPEWAEAMEERLANVRGRAVDVDGISKQIRDGITPDLQAIEQRARNYARIDLSHEDWEDTVKTPAFSTWLQSQPEDVRALAGSDRARDAIKLLDGYVAATKANDPPATQPAKQNTQSRLEAAVAPTRANTVTRREIQSEQEAADAAFKRVRGG